MKPHADRCLPIPCAFDVAIGYWTGEPDWALVAEALQAASAGTLSRSEIDAWVRIGGGRTASLVVGEVAVLLEGEMIVLRGETAAVEELACVLERGFGS